MPREHIPEPWASFLSEVDGLLQEEVELHCFGGFVVTLLFGLTRTTADLDVFPAADLGAVRRLIQLAGKDPELHRRRGVYLDLVTIASVPDGYDERLTEMFRGRFKHLRLLAFDPYDLALAKLERNLQRDRDDVKYLARSIPLNLELLKARYRDELRPLLANPEREDLTLRLWVEAIEEEISS